MKNCRIVILACTTCMALVALLGYADTLTPPGPPGSAAASMKTLNQIEPRVLIESLPTTITNPGSYYIMQSLTVTQSVTGISIECRDVQIDLGGFTLVGAGGSSQAGIYILGPYRNITIQNGVIRNWGWEGIWGPTAVESHVKRVSVISNGWSGILLSHGSFVEDCMAVGNAIHGIQVGNNSTVQKCTAMSNTQDGIHAGANSKVYDCTSANNGGDGLAAGDGSRLNGCTSSSNQDDGIVVGIASVVQACLASGNTANGVTASNAVRVIECNTRGNEGNGICAEDSSVVLNCISSFNGVDGIQVTSNCRVEENNCIKNGQRKLGAGVHGVGKGNRIDNNNVSENSRGVLTSSDGSIVLRNTAHDNGSIPATHNYDLTNGTHYGRIALDINGQILTDQPWVNFSF